MRTAVLSALTLVMIATSASPALARGGDSVGVRTERQTRDSNVIQPVALLPASASTVILDPIDSDTLNTVGTEIFGAVLTGSGDFSNIFGFTLDDSYTANSQVGTIDLSGIGVDFTSLFLDSYAYSQSSVNPEVWVLDPAVSLLAGAHTLYVNGTIGSAGAGSYSGNINLTAAAVPEPAVWGMLLLGFGAIGSQIRRRRKARSDFSPAIA